MVMGGGGGGTVLPGGGAGIAVRQWFDEPEDIAVIEVPGVASLLPAPPTQDYSDAVTLVQDFEEGLQHTWDGEAGKAKLDIDGLTQDGSPDGAADYVATWDASAGAHKKVLLEDLPGGGPGGSPEVEDVQFTDTDRICGRDTAGGGNGEELTVSGGLEFTGSGGIRRSALTGDVTASAGSNSTTVANDAVTYAKMQNVSAASKLLGRGSSGSGDPQEITLGTGLAMTATTLDSTAAGNAGGDLDGSYPSPTVVGLTTPDISLQIDSIADGDFLRRSGATIIGDSPSGGSPAVEDIEFTNSDRLAGRDTAGSGPGEEITVGGGVEFTGSGGIRRSALTGDVTASAGSNSTTIANDAVSDAKLRNSGACSVIGRSANSSGDPADISAGGNDTVCRRVSDTVSFGQLTVGMAANDLWTYAKIQNVSATDKVLGRSTAGAGDIEEIACTAAGRALIDDTDAAAQRATLSLWNSIWKTGETARSSNTTLANDPDLQFSMSSGKTYSIRCVVWTQVDGGDFKWALTGPTASIVSVQRRWVVPSGAAYAGVAVDAAYTTSQAMVGTNGRGYVCFEAQVTTTASGTFAFQWAQNSSHANASQTVRGSWLDWRQVD